VLKDGFTMNTISNNGMVSERNDHVKTPRIVRVNFGLPMGLQVGYLKVTKELT
jgi:hypothetical protein